MKEEKKQKHYLIYQITNLADGKIYIGKHETFNIEDNYFGSGNLIRAAINKYDLENFVKTILIDLKSREEMNLLEKMVVTEEFCKREDVYNIKVGGEGGWDYINQNGLNHSGNFISIGNACRKIFETTGQYPNKGWADRLKKNNPSKYKDLCKQKQIEQKNIVRNMTGKRNPMFGKHHKEKSKIQMSISHLGIHNNQYGKMWICNDLTGESKTILKTNPIPDGWRKGRLV